MPAPSGVTTGRSSNSAGIIGWYNFLDYGGYADNVHDDGAALGALSAAIGNNGGVIVMPPGTYNLASSPLIRGTQTLIISGGVTLNGAGTITTTSTGTILDYRGGLSVNGALLPAITYINSPVLSATSVSQPLWLPPDSTTWKVVSCACRYTAASSSGTLQVEVADTGVAVGSGVNQLTSALALSGTINVNQLGAVTNTPPQISNAKSVNVILGGTLTGLAGLVVTVGLQRLS